MIVMNEVPTKCKVNSKIFYEGPHTYNFYLLDFLKQYVTENLTLTYIYKK